MALELEPAVACGVAPPIGVLARSVYRLPYLRADMRLQEHQPVTHFTSSRAHPGAPTAQFAATSSGGDMRPPAAPGSLNFFLIERYCLRT
jgi:uncharacterized protein YqjF (DUF2071 family)